MNVKMKKNDKPKARNPAISVNVAPQLFERITAAADAEDRSVASWMRRLAEAALAAKDQCAT